MKKNASASKEASGILVYLVEELGDARLRCAQLKKLIKDATDIVDKSEHRDHLFEVAGNLIYGIPDTLMKLDKALDATALAAARLDYEEIKNGLRPEKADELEQALTSTRLRYLNRRSNHIMWPGPVMKGTPLKTFTNKGDGMESNVWENPQGGYNVTLRDIDADETLPHMTKFKDLNQAIAHAKKLVQASTSPPKENQTMNAKTAAYFLNKIASLTERQGRIPVAAIMTLVSQLEHGSRKASILNQKAPEAFRNLAAAIVQQKNPSRIEIATVLRRIVGDTFAVEEQQAPVQQRDQGQQQQQQAGAGEQFQKANPKITDEEAKVIDEMHDKNKDVVKDKHQA